MTGLAIGLSEHQQVIHVILGGILAQGRAHLGEGRPFLERLGEFLNSFGHI